MSGKTTHCPSHIPDVSSMLVPPLPHSILGTANIVCRVVAGTINIIHCMGGQAVQPFVDGMSSIVIEWSDMVPCPQIPPLMETARPRGNTGETAFHCFRRNLSSWLAWCDNFS